MLGTRMLGTRMLGTQKLGTQKLGTQMTQMAQMTQIFASRVHNDPS